MITAVPEPLRKQLLSELTAARSQHGSDPAQPRVHDAELALGTAGADPRTRLAATMRALLRHRRPDATICPSDAARVVGGGSWRDLMPTARDVAAELSRAGTLVVRQHGTDVDITTATGPVRLARGPRWDR
ncbi:DUF3253 domain-containing protein [Actinoplanes sp. N902-109]|uniref:DUF3253 domain-containing protein n=1 Tax=Actinoplanes sp. (strain N902-109) TaxID=649831 RepID=UPI000329537B|nr:DUF3253 domain-containing protein [Actinoplanes sp. N902-109]AGL18789.1 hypothetical protein L083_5279 [Actinoplanes sp. N902-109]